MRLRVILALRLALLVGIVSLPCGLWAEEPYFSLGGSRLQSQRSSPAKRRVDIDLVNHEDQEAPDEESAAGPGKVIAGGESAELLADGPGELPPPVDWSSRYHTSEVHNMQTPGAYDTVGSLIGAGDPNRPLYPYKATEPWIAQDADPESWGDLAELPYVQLGWFANVESTVYAGRVNGQFKSGTLLDATFPGETMDLSVAPIDVNISPRIEVGYRYERGLGETRLGYQYYGFQGSDTLPNYDLGAPARRTSRVAGHVFDLDFCEFEFNPEGLPLIHPLFKFPGRAGLGKPLTPGKYPPPLEMKFVIGGRGAKYYTDATAVGPTTTDQVYSNFWGGGLHFTWDLNQRLRHDVPVFWHLRADGSGTFGRIDQKFARTRGADVATAVDPQDWIGVPTVSLEAGLSWAPELPCRTSRFTLAYHYEQWFSYGQATNSTTDLMLNGILLRGEWKY